MAKNVIAQVLGGEKKILDDVMTVADAADSLDISASEYAVAVNGNAVESGYQLNDGNFVTFTKKVKGGQ